MGTVAANKSLAGPKISYGLTPIRCTRILILITAEEIETC